jgi:two-component system, cell cycle sensor histidine kinase and response regulator CckA
VHPTPSTPNADKGQAGSASCILERRGTGRVLVIEDDTAIRIVFSRALTRLGFTATLAADGAEALSQFRADPNQYALALLDFKLPGMTSEDVLRGIRSERPDLPVILTSGYDRDEAMNRLNGMQITSFLHKPFTADSLARELRFALGD